MVKFHHNVEHEIIEIKNNEGKRVGHSKKIQLVKTVFMRGIVFWDVLYICFEF